MNNTLIQRRTVLLGGMLLGAGVKAMAAPEPWPSRPIRLVVAGSAGAGGDIFARLIADPLGKTLKQPVVVDAKPGANGLIACDTVAKAPGDGYTLLFAPSSSILINPVIHPKLPYNAETDLVPVAQVGAAGILLMTNPSTGFKNLADMVAYAKAHPGKLAYGSWGTGSSGHLAMEGIKAHYGLDMPHVPYKTIVTEVTDLIANNISVAFTDIASPIPHMRNGRLVALGQTGSQRWPATRDVPTLAEQGYKFEADGWYGVFAPAGTPTAIIDRLNEEINRLQKTDEVRQKIEGQNMIVPPSRSAKQFAASVKKDAAIWQGLAKVTDLSEK
ncbi:MULTISPECIES: tripartite tricarboxylate transporter substrate binding protein [unclassified Variovorax]|jgi:tripartite-type tricarboxylate transporter receptor subunit TctC|uniref:Bug family tripartite tricarboxylate transporter substrate binding protein n=1 Tax=unclassified Variovorax TaxID=663243 RepID=UPI002575B2D6|nr:MULTISPECIES: tripartite tricarboxylate transporter substrate binding protein [unclassified Variovorax]MDM0066580.1 tripartite tricarboxylate transporter substrate binding protein [Variovorax sp. J31P207]MDM0079335.1 tripartite tricarboxylate transporter substrate binding protein [Variovorax sp. J31P179]HET7837401.1 tripartite tricarboxylate transporter substrate binding protein [Variovorax sp.]